MSKGEGLYPAPTNRIEELDAKITNLGKSTRASIPAMIPIHDTLRQKFRWYYNWSAFSGSKIVHWMVLFVYLAGASAFTANLFYAPRVASAASVKTWATKTDWQQWKLNNLSLDVKEGALVLAPESIVEINPTNQNQDTNNTNKTNNNSDSSTTTQPIAPTSETPAVTPMPETPTTTEPSTPTPAEPTSKNPAKQIAGEQDQASPAPAPSETPVANDTPVSSDVAPNTDNPVSSTDTTDTNNPTDSSQTTTPTQDTTPTVEVKKDITYKTSGTAKIEFTPKKDEVVDWLSAKSDLTTNDQTIKFSYSTDNVVWSENLEKIQDSETLFIKISFATTDPKVTPELRSLNINYSRYPEKPRAETFYTGEVTQDRTPTLKTSKFKDPDKDSHMATRWQLTNDSGNYKKPIVDKIVNKDSISYHIGDKLNDGIYFWRTKYQDSTGAWSLWSDEGVFIVGNLPQDIKSMRTESTRTYDKGNDVKELAAYSGPIHYKENYNDKNAEWKDINSYHIIDTQTYYLHDQLSAPVKVFKNKIGYEIESRRTGEKYTIELVDTDKEAQVKAAPEVDSNQISRGFLASSARAQQMDEGNIDFNFDISTQGVRLWKTIEGPDAPQQFKWKVTKSGSGNDLKFRENPEAFEIKNEAKKVKIETEKTKLDANTFIWQETAPKTNLTIDTDVTFYPNKNVESTSVDGWASYNLDLIDMPADWTAVRGGTGDLADDDDASGNYAYADWLYQDGQWESLVRSNFLFDTSSIGSGSTITASTLSLYGSGKSDCGATTTPNINLYSANPTSETAIAMGDYATAKYGITAFSTTKAYADWSSSAYNAFALNASGLSNISKTGRSKFSARFVDYDVTGTTPANGNPGVDCTMYFSGYFADDETGGGGTDRDPKLAVTYTPAGNSVAGTSDLGSGTVAVAVNGTKQAQTGSISGGTWSISGVTISSGDVVTVFVDGAAEASESTAVTKSTGADITGMVLNANVLSIGAANNQSLTVTNLSQYTNGGGASQDEDVMHGVASSVLTVDAGGSYSTENINVLSGNTLTIGAAETLTTYSATMTGSLVATTTATFNVAGNWTNNGTYTKGSETVTFNGSAAQTIAGSAATSFTSVTISNTSAAIAVNTNINISGTLTVNASAIVTPAAAVVINTSAAAGTITGSGRVNVTRTAATADYSSQYKFTTNTLTNLTVVYTGASAQSVSAVTYGNLTVDMSGQTATAAGNFEVGKVLNINAGTFDASSRTITLSGTSGTPFVKTGTFTASTSTIIYSGNYGSGNTNVVSTTYYNLQVNNGSETYAAAGDITVSNVLTITTGTFDASNRTITLSGTTGTPFVKTGTFTASTSTIAYTGNYADGNTNVVATTYYNLTLNNGSETYAAAGTLDVDAGLTITAGTLAMGANNMTVAGNFANSGIFSSSALVTLDGAGASTQAISGDTTFNNLTATAATARTLQFASDSTTVVSGTWTVTGSVDQKITLQASGANNWIINPTAASVSYVSVSKSTNSGVTFCATYSDGSSNTGWSISATDSCIPTAPSGVTLDTLTTTGFRANWTDNSSSESGFKVFVSTVPNADCSLATYGGAPDYTTAADAVNQSVTDKSVNTQYCAKIIATSGFGDSSAAYADAAKYTLANVPSAPTVNATSSSSLTVIINANSNPASTEFAIYNETSVQYVQADGTLGAGAVWQNRATWGGDAGIANTALSIDTTYSYQVKARNGDTTETALSDSAAKYTLANTPSAPTVVANSWDSGNGNSLTVTINANSNPAGTQFAIACNATPDSWLQGDGTCGVAKVWHAKADWETGTVNYLTNLTSDTNYDVVVIARNGDTTETSASGTTTTMTAPAQVANLTHSANTTASVTWSWDANGTAPDGYNVYEYALGVCTSTQKATVANPGTSVEEGTLSANTQYTRCARAYRGAILGQPAAQTSAYTSIETPTGITFGTIAVDSIQISASGTISNLASDLSGLYFTETTAANGGGGVGFETWTQINDLTDSGLSVNTQYTYKVKARNGDGDETAETATSNKYTLANTPSAPTVNATSTTSLTVIINVNSNPAATEFAIYNETSAQYVQADGTLGAGEVWQNYATWGGAGGIANTGLSVNTTYTYKVKAQNGDGTDTDLSAGASKYTLANTPSAPTVNATSTTSLTVIINVNSNPAATEFAIYNETSAQYVQADGTLGAGEVWQNYATWGGAGGIANTGLSVNTTYTYKIKAQNGDGTDTDLSGGASKYTLANVPSAPTVAANSWDAVNGNSITVTINANSNPAATEFAISCDGTPTNWLQNDGSCAGDKVWKIKTDWETGTVNYLKNLTGDTEYTILTLAKNGDGTETANSDTAAVTTAPAQPTGLAHTANTTTTITWDWNDNASAPDGYNLLSGTDETVETAVGASTVAQDQSDAIGTPLVANTQYTVKVRAYRGALTGQPTDTVSIYTSIETPTGITFGTIAADSIQISASGTISNLASDLSGLYFTETTGGAGGGGVGFETWTQANDLTDSGLSVNTQYTYKVKARNGDGDETAETATSNKYTLANAPSAPAVAANYSEANSYYTDVVIAANSNPAGTNYKITWDTDAGGAFSDTLEDWTAHTNGDTVTHTDLPGGLTCNQTYYYRVMARNGDTTETATATGSDTTPACAPANPIADTITSTSAMFNWDAVAGPAATYTTSYGTDAAATNLGETAGIGDIFLAQPGLTASTTYYFKVKAVNTNGTGAWSAIDDFTTDAPGAVIDHLLIRLPGQTFTAGSGISGTANHQTAGTAFTGHIIAVDAGDNIVNATDTVSFTTATDSWIATYNGGDPAPADPVTLVAGEGDASFTFYRAATNHVINASDGATGSSSQFTVDPATTSASNSNAILSDSSVEVGQTATLSIRLKDVYGNNIPSHAVTVSSDQAGDVISYSASTTSSSGTILAYITSGLTHTSTLTITDNTDGITLTTAPQIEFTPPTSIDNPTHFTGTAGDTTVTLSWQNPTSAFFSHIQIYRSTSPNDLGNLIKNNATGESYTDTGLTNDTDYYYTLKAVDTYGNISTGTEQLKLTPTSLIDTEAPSAPRNLRAIEIDVQTITLAWDAATDNVGVVGYRIYNADTGIEIGATVSRTFTLNDLSAQTTYRFFVRAYDASGNVSAPSNTLSVTTLSTDAEKLLPGAAAFLIISNAPSEAFAGVAFSQKLKVLAADAGGGLIKDYRGAVYFTSTDKSARLTYNRTNPYTFNSADAGSHEFSGGSFTLNTIGEQKLSVTDGRTTGSVAIMVSAYGLKETYQKVQNKVTDFFADNANTVNTAVVATTGLLVLAPLLINALLSLSSFGPQLIYWLSQILQFIGIRKRRKPWGVAFNSLTGQPISLTVIRIYDKEYNRLLESVVTDPNGRFGFLWRPGSFYIVAQKSGYIFPSEYKASSYFDHLYTGGVINIAKEERDSIVYNIPLDPQVKPNAGFKLMASLIKIGKLLRKLRMPLLVVGIIFATLMIIYSYSIIFVLSIIFYVFIVVLEYMRTFNARPYGVVSDTYGHPLEMAIVRIYEKHSGRMIETDVTDIEGRFKFLVKPGVYYLTAIKPGYLDFKSHIMYLEKEKTLVSTNIKLKKVDKIGA